jgi:hypothetical protein
VGISPQVLAQAKNKTAAFEDAALGYRKLDSTDKASYTLHTLSADQKLCVRCGKPVTVHAGEYEIFEKMHWLCFHLEFEHAGDPDEPCGEDGAFAELARPMETEDAGGYVTEDRDLIGAKFHARTVRGQVSGRKDLCRSKRQTTEAQRALRNERDERRAWSD